VQPRFESREHGGLKSAFSRLCAPPTDDRMAEEKPYRSLVKAISWRVTGTLDTILISWLITGQVKWALSIGFIELFTKIFLYYLHERIWNRLDFGRVKGREDFNI
jgi:uncharacterized membrane protein